MSDFKLSATLVGHDDDVRAVVFPHPNVVVSASRDATVRLWKATSTPYPKFHDTITQHGTSWYNALAYVPPTPKFKEGLIVSGGKDSIIEVRQPSSAPDANAEALLLGHAHNVCALDVDPEGKYIVSGSWDGTARTWPVGKPECETVFEGHQGSVWAVLAYDEETIITGCADQHIRVFHKSGKLLKSFTASKDVIRALCKVPQNHPSGADFASAGNDGVIHLWALNGRHLGELVGHESFIYSLTSLPSGELVSSGEDRTVRIWNGTDCIQTITHPAISVWSVAANQETGDIVSGASDRIVRVFTRSPERIADPEAIQLFEESVKASSIPKQQVGNINSEQLPGPEFLANKAGTKDGQVQMIKESNGSITAHQWSMSQQQWISIGTVVDSVGSSGNKVDYLGKEYDYVFDVDIEEGKPALKLPYNLSQNPYEAATKFLEDNKLPISYLDQVANFITTNTQGATLGASQNQAPELPGSDPWGSGRYVPGGDVAPPPTLPPAPKVLPQKEYLNILVARVDNMEKKIRELNQELFITDKEISLNPTELSILSSLSSNLSSGATASSASITGGLDLALKLTTTWPYPSRLPGLDLLRLLAVAPETATYTNPRGMNIVSLLEQSITDHGPPAENNVMLAIRAFANLFDSAEGRELCVEEFDIIFSIAETSLKNKTMNRNLLVAITTLAINYAVLFTSASSSSIPETKRFEYSIQWLELLVKVLSEQKDAEVIYRALVAVGTFVGGSKEIRTAAREVLGVKAAVEAAGKKVVDARNRGMAREVIGVLG